jgi:N-acetylglucosaminyl-diphospho-decaprenol L-rhamnosyltransferase
MGVPDWAVITVTYNSAQTLRRCWSGGSTTYDWIVVDNCSTDGSADVAEELGAHVIRLPENVGFSAANNVAVRESVNPYLLFANPDLVVSADGLPRLRTHLDRHGGLVAPQLLSTNGDPQPNGRGFPYATAKLGNRNLWPFSRLHASYRILAACGETVWVAWTIGAAVAARRADFARMGGWNERFFIYYEDADLGLRAWQDGQPVAVLGDVRWTHHWSRATNTLRWNKAHTYEVRAARTFYSMYPEFLFGLPRAARRHPLAAARSGLPVAGDDARVAA